MPGIAGASWRRQVRLRALGDPADPSRPADLCSPTPAGTAAAPMFHRCRLDDTDVPSVLLRPHGPTARRRSAHTPTAASMTSRRTGPVVAGSACPALPGSGCHEPRTRRRTKHICRFRHISVVDPGFVVDPPVLPAPGSTAGPESTAITGQGLRLT